MSSTFKTSELDPIPNWLLKDGSDSLLTCITKIVNLPMLRGVFSDDVKRAIPLMLKSVFLDFEIEKNYHPVFNLTFFFLSNVTEKAR